MVKKYLPLIFPLVILDILLIVWLLIRNFHFAVFDPAGIIAQKEYALFITVGTLGLFVVVTVMFTTFFIVWKYREDNENVKRHSDSSGSRTLTLLWWTIPSIIIGILAVITWTSTHALDPHKPLVSHVEPIRIQVVALQWKWLFIYPEQNIATINYVVFPEKTPITFELTADAPMNSFWIPQLGGQMYAMEGMVNKLHLMAEKQGEFKGVSAEISGEGFAGMRFVAKSTSNDGFASWVEKIKQSSNPLDRETYNGLVKPTENHNVTFYAPVSNNLYNEIVMKYMHPAWLDEETANRSVQKMHH